VCTILCQHTPPGKVANTRKVRLCHSNAASGPAASGRWIAPSRLKDQRLGNGSVCLCAEQPKATIVSREAPQRPLPQVAAQQSITVRHPFRSVSHGATRANNVNPSFVTVPAGWCHESVQVLNSAQEGCCPRLCHSTHPPWGAHKGLGRHREVLARPAVERGSAPSQLLPHTPPSGGRPGPYRWRVGLLSQPKGPPERW